MTQEKPLDIFDCLRIWKDDRQAIFLASVGGYTATLSYEDYVIIASKRTFYLSRVSDLIDSVLEIKDIKRKESL